MKTLREQYMANEITFADYYRAIAKGAGIAFQPGSDFIKRCQTALARGDEHLNTIPLREWDMKAACLLPGIRTTFKWAGDSDTLAGRVCTLKQAARDAAEKGQAS